MIVHCFCDVIDKAWYFQKVYYYGTSSRPTDKKTHIYRKECSVLNLVNQILSGFEKPAPPIKVCYSRG